MRARLLLPASLAAIAVACGAACGAFAQSSPATALPPTASPKALPSDLPLPVLQSLSYVDIAANRALPLENGVYRDAQRELRLVSELQAAGDLDGDGTRDAAVLLEDRARATGVPTLHLAGVVQRAFRVRNMASFRLGEHVQARSLSIHDRQAIVSLLVMGEGDAPARPTLKMTLALKLAGSEWQVMRQEPGGRFAIADLAGTAWTLAADPAITASFARAADGALRLTGRTHCARYAATLTEEGAVAELATLPANSAKTPCSAEALEADRAFLATLAGARGVAFRFGRLALGSAIAFARE